MGIVAFQALIFKLRGVTAEDELGPDESWLSPVDVNLVRPFF